MSNVDRRTLEELMARYEFEPELRDIYVEGEFDCDLLKSSLGNKLCDHFIYSIDTVDIPGEILQSYSLSSGNKQRVIALAKELESKLNGEFNYLCLTDRDLDHWFGELEDIRNHRWTKFASLEMHFFNADYLQHYLSTVCKVKIDNFVTFMTSFTMILTQLFALRCIDKELELELRWVSVEKCISKKNGALTFDFDDYLSRTLNKSVKFELFEQVREGVGHWLSRLSGDPRQLIRGHDFVLLLSWVIKNFGGIKEISTETAIYRLFVSAALNDQKISCEIAA